MHFSKLGKLVEIIEIGSFLDTIAPFPIKGIF